MKTVLVSPILSIQTPYKADYSSLAGQVLLLFGWWVIWNGRWQKEKWWGLSSTLKMSLKSKSSVVQHFLISQGSPHRTLISTFPALQGNYVYTHTHINTCICLCVYIYVYFSSYKRWKDHHREYLKMLQINQRMNKRTNYLGRSSCLIVFRCKREFSSSSNLKISTVFLNSGWFTTKR